MTKWQKKYLKENIYMEDCVKVEKSAKIGVGSVIMGETIICSNATILPYCVINASHIMGGAVVGPFSHLREGTIIKENAKVGAFCEVKKSEIGEKTKIPHLSYVGDAVLGKNCNIGCGTIFCNYDGKNKHKTIVEDNVFIGSNVNLIAPLKIEKNVFVAAGTTVNKNVESDKFVIGRCRQEVKEKR